MKIATKVVVDIESGLVLEWEGYDYHGPVDLCDRGTSKQVAQTGIANSKQDQANAQASLAGANQGASALQADVNAFKAANPYKIGGEADVDNRTILSNTSNAGSNSLADAMRLNATRTGQNGASYAPALAEAQRTASRDLATSSAQADQERIANDAKYRAQGVQFDTLSPDLQSRLYGTSIGAANGALNTAGSAAAASPGFLDTLGTSFASTLGKTLGGGNITATKAF